MPPPLIPDFFPGKYRILARLGGGAYGDVWLAEEVLVSKSRVAIKALKPGGDPATAEARLESLIREAMVLRELRHRNIVPIYTWEKTADGLFLGLLRAIGHGRGHASCNGPRT